MKQNSLFKRIIASILSLVMVLGVFTVFAGAFGNVYAYAVNPDTGERVYGSGANTVVLNKDAWLNDDGTYNIDLTAFITGQPKVSVSGVPAATDFILVIDQSESMEDSIYCSEHNLTVTSGKLSAMKAAARALVDALAEISTDEIYHRVGIIGFGNNTTCNVHSTTGLFDDVGNWHNYRDFEWEENAQNYYDRVLVPVNTENGRSVLNSSINQLRAEGGTRTHIGMEMAKGVIEATANDTFSYERANGDIATMLRRKVVVVFTDGTPGYWGFDMDWAAQAINTATEIKADLGATIFTVSLKDQKERDHHDAYDCEGLLMFGRLKTRFGNEKYYYFEHISDGAGRPGWDQTTRNAVPTNSIAFTDTRYDYYAYEKLGLEGEFLSRDFNALLSSTYPCTAQSGPNSRIVAKYDTAKNLWDFIRPSEANGANTKYNGYKFQWPSYWIDYGYEPKTIQHDREIAYFYQRSDSKYVPVAGMYSLFMNNYGTEDNLGYYHELDGNSFVTVPQKQYDPEYGKYYIEVESAYDLLGNNASVPGINMENLIAAFTEIAGSFFTETLPELAAPITDAAFIKDIVSENFEIPADFSVQNNVKVYTQNATGCTNGKFTFGALEPVNNPVVTVNADSVAVNFDFNSNACMDLNGGVTGKKIVVRISGLLAKPDKVGELQTNNPLSGLYSSETDDEPSVIFDNNGNPGESLLFPEPSVTIREKHIVYDFSLVIKDDNAEEFFAETRAADVSGHDVAYVLTLDDPYAKQNFYHDQYPFDTVKHADLFDHFSANIIGSGEGNSYLEIVIKSINGNQYDLAAMLQLTETVKKANGS
ncbi:MAG: VWA domain-containing protein, partial [Clostridia bacterium]|nr:VWA domain-containing protein [Clostridia bacterium]